MKPDIQKLDTPEARRIAIHKRLESIKGVRKVYFQPPESVKLKYDCIVYKIDGLSLRHASDMPYTVNRAYIITVIYQDPTCDIPDRLAIMFPKINHNRNFVANNLYHSVFILYD